MSTQSHTRRRGRPARPSFRVVTWNIGGAKFFGLPKEPTAETAYTRTDFQQTLNTDLQRLTRDFQPDVILMQETVRFGSAAHPDDLILAEGMPEYHYDMSVAIDTVNQSHPQKWDKYRKFWPDSTHLAELALNVNPLPLAQYCVSDHFPVLADVPIVPMMEG